MSFLTHLVARAYAAAPNITPVPDPGGAPQGFNTSINNIFTNVLNMLTLLAGILAVMYLIWAGLQYITSAGNPEKTKLARGAIINAMIGIIIIVAAYFIIRFAVGLGGEAARLDASPTPGR